MFTSMVNVSSMCNVNYMGNAVYDKLMIEL